MVHDLCAMAAGNTALMKIGLDSDQAQACSPLGSCVNVQTSRVPSEQEVGYFKLVLAGQCEASSSPHDPLQFQDGTTGVLLNPRVLSSIDYVRRIDFAPTKQLASGQRLLQDSAVWSWRLGAPQENQIGQGFSHEFDLAAMILPERALLAPFSSLCWLCHGTSFLCAMEAKLPYPCRAFDVCYVVDPTRSWYHGGDDVLFARWQTRLEAITNPYPRVLLLGDSMGAAACLLFAPLATAAAAFCPQVNLERSSIRPGKDREWFATYQARVTASLEASTANIQVCTDTGAIHTSATCIQMHGEYARTSASIPVISVRQAGWWAGDWSANSSNRGLESTHTYHILHHAPTKPVAMRWPAQHAAQVHTGTWQHDLDQVRGLPTGSVSVNVHQIDSHRLAFAMDAKKELLPVVHALIAEQMGYRINHVRMANLL